jgi:hypothetical protein
MPVGILRYGDEMLLLADLSFLFGMRIVLAGVLDGIVMFIWTSIAHMGLPLGEAGIGEIPNESVVLSAMQSSMGEKTGLYIFPGLGVGKNASREEKNEAMKQMQQRIAANPSGITHVSSARTVSSHLGNRSPSSSALKCSRQSW